jgi:DNA polymerase III subunit chi
MVPAKVEFHSGVSDVRDHAARLIRKALVRGARVAVTGATPDLQALDAGLWTSQPGDFVPHVMVLDDIASPSAMHRTPIWLVARPNLAVACPVLVNLGHLVPDGWQRFDRLIEVVGSEPSARAAGRVRWRTYESASVPIEHVRMDLPAAERVAVGRPVDRQAIGAGG